MDLVWGFKDWNVLQRSVQFTFHGRRWPCLVRMMISLNPNVLDSVYARWEWFLLCYVCAMLVIMHCSLKTLSSITSWIPFWRAIKQNLLTKIRHHLFQAGSYFEFWWLPAKYASFLFCEISSVSKNLSSLVFCFFSSCSFSPQSSGKNYICQLSAIFKKIIMVKLVWLLKDLWIMDSAWVINGVKRFN